MVHSTAAGFVEEGSTVDFEVVRRIVDSDSEGDSTAGAVHIAVEVVHIVAEVIERTLVVEVARKVVDHMEAVTLD